MGYGLFLLFLTAIYADVKHATVLSSVSCSLGSQVTLCYLEIYSRRRCFGQSLPVLIVASLVQGYLLLVEKL
jgi:hypothetical protein